MSKNEVKYEIRCLFCNKCLAIEQLKMDVEPVILGTKRKARKVIFHVKTCFHNEKGHNGV